MADDGQSYTILVIDDNENLRFLVAESLKRLGRYRVVTAEDGIKGLQAFYEERPDCAVVDIKMPGLDGYQLVRVLRGDPETAGIPLVLLTALNQDQDRFTGLAAGADLFLVKPVRPLELVAAIQQAIAQSEADREAQLAEMADELAPPFAGSEGEAPKQ